MAWSDRTSAKSGAASRRPVTSLSPIGFWSYARQDDKASRDALSKLRLLLKYELEQQLGTEIDLFQDVGAIPHGAEWEREIRHAVGKAHFFIPIVTPRFLRSEWCNKEMRLFVERQDEIRELYPDLGNESLIFPILYVDVKDVDPLDPEAFAEITKRQYLEFTHLRLSDYEGGAGAASLGKAGFRHLPAPPPPSVADRRLDANHTPRLSTQLYAGTRGNHDRHFRR